VESLESELARARDLAVPDLADAIESIGFECTRCGACCTAHEGPDGAVDEHVATVFPDEVRRLQGAPADRPEPGSAADADGSTTAGDAGSATGNDAGSDGPDDDGDADAGRVERDWRDVVRPTPFGLRAGPDGPEGETFEWSLAVDDCGDCAFYEERPAPADGEADGDGGEDADAAVGHCTVHDARPLVCRTYPFSVALAGTSQPMGEAVDEAGVVRAHECEGLGRDISREAALDLAAALKERAVRELAEAIAVRDAYEPAAPGPGEVVVHDSEGAKRPDGTPLDAE
jgi:hypothetical protein